MLLSVCSRLSRIPNYSTAFPHLCCALTTSNFRHARRTFTYGLNPEKDHVIYKGVLGSRLFFVKAFSFGCSVVSIAFQFRVWNRADQIKRSVLVAVSSMLAVFTFITPLLIHFIAKKYCIQISYNRAKDVYKATTYSFFLSKKTITFTPADVVVPTVNRLFTIALIKGKPMFFDAEHFDGINHYKRIMGYDKPIDFSYVDAEKKKD